MANIDNKIILSPELQKQEDDASALPDLTGASSGAIMQAMWGTDASVLNEIKNTNLMFRSKHGMFSSIPLICRGKDCKYKDVCVIRKSNRKVGRRCPMEISAIVTRFEQWCRHFNIDCDGEYISDEDMVDATLIKDLVNNEIQSLRAENKIAMTGDFIGQTLAEIDKKCNPYYEDAVTPESQFLLTLQDKRFKILNLLNSTRKDKAQASRGNQLDPSEQSIQIFKRVQDIMKQEKEKGNIIDLDQFDEEVVDNPTELNQTESIISDNESF